MPQVHDYGSMDFLGQDQKKDHEIVEFFMDARENKTASREQGIPIFDDREMVRIRFPADRQRTVVRPAHAEWKKIRGQVVTYAMRYKDHYQRFKAGETMVVHGTPLAEAPFLTEGQRRTLKALDVYTVQQLAELDGQPLKNLGMNGREMKNQALVFIQKAQGTADVTGLAAENARLREELDRYRNGMSDQTSAPSQIDQPSQTGDEFDAMTNDEIKAWIADMTGARPAGNPGRERLLADARELAAKANPDQRAAA